MTPPTAWDAIKIGAAEALGFVVLLPACIVGGWTAATEQSSKPWPYGTESVGPYRPLVDQWRWKWLNPWYSNVEDGVSGQQAWVWDTRGNVVSLIPYASLYYAWVPKWVIAYAWSAWRNGANNIKRPFR
jgi:hypothetical protein